MMRRNDTVWCDGCGIEILGSPWIYDKRDFCCQDCAAGYHCECGNRLEAEDERRKQDNIPLAP